MHVYTFTLNISMNTNLLYLLYTIFICYLTAAARYQYSLWGSILILLQGCVGVVQPCHKDLVVGNNLATTL